MKRNACYGSRFRRDFKQAARRGLDMRLLRRVMKCLENAPHWKKSIGITP